MRAEVNFRGKSGRVSWRSEFRGSSYNDGGVLAFTWKGEKCIIRIDTYTAQSKQACQEIMDNWYKGKINED